MNFTQALKQLEGDSINVTLMWDELETPALFSHHINIIPEASYTFAETRLITNILLDISYNVSIVATHVCGQAMPIISIGLYYCELHYVCVTYCMGLSATCRLMAL